MPGKILGLDIHSNSLTAVQITSGLKGYQITACAHILFKVGQKLEEALSELMGEMDLKSDLYVSSIPVEDLSIRNISLPFRDTKKIRQTLPFELESLVPFPLNELVVDFQVSPGEGQSEVLAVSSRKSVIAGYLSRLQGLEIDPEVIEVQPAPLVSWLITQDKTPVNGLLIYIGLSRSTMGLYLDNKIVLMRTFGHKQVEMSIPNEARQLTPERIEAWIKDLSAEIIKTLHAYKWQHKLTAFPEKIFFTGPGALYSGMADLLTRFLELPAEQVNISRDAMIGVNASISRTWNPALMDTALALALRNGRKGARFNFRKDEFEIQKPYLGIKKEIRRLGLPLMFVLAFFITDLLVDYYFLKGQYQALKGRVEEIAREALPNEPIVDPKTQIERKISSLISGSDTIPGIRADERVLDLILDISERIPEGIEVLFTRMIVDPETIRISGVTDNFNSVDSIKNGLDPSKYFNEVTISSANLDKTGKQVRFELRLQRAE